MKYQIDVSKVKKIQGSIWDQIKETFAYRKGVGEPLPVFGHYGGLFKCGDETLVMHADGVGTKLLVAQALGKFDTVGIDAVAMSVNDILCVGAEPLVGLDYIALAQEDASLVEEIMRGLVEGARQSRCAIIGGETAVIPDLIHGGEKPFDLTFTVVGRIKKQILGDAIRSGDVIVGLESSGIHSNGYTLARSALDVSKWGNEMLIPTRIYCAPVLEMIDSCEIHGLAHITGGGFSKITRLNKSVGFVFDSLPDPSPIFQALYEKVRDDRQMHCTFNMGVGMAIVVPQKEAQKLIDISKRHGVSAQIIGKVVSKPGVWLKKNGREIDLST
ncbi:phosphoribosylformylglycinamidine cyclo-ligase [Candidatus Micrarchaeota archaeon]|nr:phosphoribosylformylglycinamidine cyclo-ligase [Candidatus Micrarchaeota archaeon]